MPFKLRLKKSKQYNVVTKAVFVICVELLDNSIVECTLSADSHGYDCLDNVCQRLGLNQPEFFGLRYVSQKSYPRVRWVELDRPLKKQLDKHAQEAYLYLRIMYYVNDVSLLQDEMTRYHYFLQLKSDVMEGRLRCSYSEAIVLAGYRLQAEFGDHDPERHTLQYLKEFVLVPKHLVTNEAQLDAMTEAVAEQHSKLLGLPQPVAECWYIMEAQHLDGYGQERFLAKEEPSGEALVATSLQGILVMRNNTERVVFYRWDDITNLLNQKRMFGIECQRSEENVQFYFDDPEAARYVWKLAVLQHTFYKKTLLTLQSMTLQSQTGDEKDADLATGLAGLNLDQVSTLQNAGMAATAAPIYEAEQPHHLQFQQQQQQQQQSQQRSSSAMGMINEYRPKLMTQSSLNGRTDLLHSVSSPSLTVLNPSTQLNLVSPRSSHTSAGGSLATSQQNLRSLLPAYRPAPDYETAVRVKYGDEMAQLLLHSPAQVVGNESQFAQPPDQLQVHQLQAPQGQHQDQQLLVHQMQMMHLYKPPPPYPYSKTGSNSSPDLAVVNNGMGFGVNTGSVGHLPIAQANPPETKPMMYPSAEPTQSLEQQQQHQQMLRSGEPIYQNIPMRHPESNPNLSAASSRGHASLQNQQNVLQQPLQESPKRKWAIPGLSSGRNASRTAVINSNPSPPVQRNLATESHPTANVKDHLRQEVESRLSDGQLLLEFELIPRRKAGADFSTAAHPDNVSRNQYQDVLPYEENRVRLRPNRDNKMGYINASHISAAVGSSQRFYIAAQGPLPSTISDFYQMIWENDVHVIIMLADTNGNNLASSNLHLAHSSKSVQSLRSHPSNSSMGGYNGFVYWPQTDSSFVEYGEFKVRRQFCNPSVRQSTTKLEIIHIPTGKQRSVWHLQYLEWAEHGCPKDVASFLNFLEEIDTVRRHAVTDVPVGKNCNTPVLVHCGAGVGRTGVAIACDVLLTWLDNNIVVDVPKLITHLRQQRMLMVQTVAQYRLIYSLILCYLDRSRLI